LRQLLPENVDGPTLGISENANLVGPPSAACAFAPNPGLFIAARVVLGLAGAAISVMALSIITAL
jgi:MFS family permease